MSNNNCESDKYRLQRFEKNKYFYGKLMTVQDFEAEQSYFDGKNQLINRLLHGSGLVCGFKEFEFVDKDGKIAINFIDGGMALDCCGREIVVPAKTSGIPIVDSEGNSVLDLTPIPYLYLKYNISYDGYVAAASKSSSCEEKCCPRRTVEDFVVIASHIAPDPNGITCRAELTKESEEESEEAIVRKWLDDIEKGHISCPECKEDQEYKVFLGEVKDGENGPKVEPWNTEKYRIFFTQKELYQFLKCHILDFRNPHNVTAKDIEALVSVDGVKNPGGDVDLIQKNSIEITSDKTAKSITIGETHSAKKDNPHEVTAKQTGALVSISGVSNLGGNIDLKEGTNIKIKTDPAAHTIEIASVDLVPDNSIKITPDIEAKSIIIGETHSANKKNPHNVTAEQTGALVSISGVSNPGGKVDLTAGANITITTDSTAHTIEIASKGGADPATTVQSVGTNLIVGTSDKYSREDHVHDLGKEVVGFVNLSETLQNQLNLLYMYLRERALKCAVSSFKAVTKQEHITEDLSGKALNIADVIKKLIDNKIYKDEVDFLKSFGESGGNILGLMRDFANTMIHHNVGDNSLTKFNDSLDDLERALTSEPVDVLQVAILQDEVCFYVTELEILGPQ